jgi:ParB family chromosome partitioning protein
MQLKDLVVSDCNIRDIDAEALDIESLKESVSSIGLISKIILRKNIEDKYEIIAGQRRFLALKEIHGEDYDLPEESYKIFHTLDDRDAVLLSVSENTQRRELSPFEMNKAALKLNQVVGLTDKDIAKYLNITPYRLKRIMALSADKNRMTDEIREELKKPDNQAKFSDAHWDKLKDVDDKDTIKDVYEQIIEKSLPPKEVPKILGAIERAKAAQKHAESNGSSSLQQSNDGAPEDPGGVIQYAHKGELILEEDGDEKTFRVKGRGEDEEVPIEHYLEYLRHPEKFKCKVSFRLKIIPLD